MGSNPSPAKQWNRGNRSLYSTVSNKVSAQSLKNTKSVHKNNHTNTKVIYKQGHMVHHSQQASVNVQGKSYPSASSINGDPAQLVYNRYHILEPSDDNWDNDQPGTTDTSDCGQSGPKNTSPVAKKQK